MIEDHSFICQNIVIEEAIQQNSAYVNPTNGVFNLTSVGFMNEQYKDHLYKLKKLYIHVDEVLGVETDLNIDMSTVTNMKSLLAKL